MADGCRTGLSLNEYLEEENARDCQALGRCYVPVVVGDTLFILYTLSQYLSPSLILRCVGRVLTEDILEDGILRLLIDY